MLVEDLMPWGLHCVGAEKEVIKENEVHAKTDPQLKSNGNSHSHSFLTLAEHL